MSPSTKENLRDQCPQNDVLRGYLCTNTGPLLWFCRALRAGSDCGVRGVTVLGPVDGFASTGPSSLKTEDKGANLIRASAVMKRQSAWSDVCSGGLAMQPPPGSAFAHRGCAKALRVENAQFGLRHILPAPMLGRIVPFEAVHKPSGLDGLKGLVKRGFGMGVEIVPNQHDLPDTRE